MHAFLGRDITSHLFGIDKGASLKRFRANITFREYAAVFDAYPATPSDVIAAGEKALVIIYNGKSTDSLDSLRYQHFCDKVASKSSQHVKPQSLPPTSAAAKYHSLRVNLQVQQWKGSADALHPTDWAWQVCDYGFVPQQKT